MKTAFILCLFLVIGCSKEINVDPNFISFKYSKEAISSPINLEKKIKSHLKNEDQFGTEELFKKSWISFFRTTNTLENKFLVEVVEHQPVAILDKKRYDIKYIKKINQN